MKIAVFIPLAYFAGADGFAIFAPYLALVMTVAGIISWARA